jgi:hypothetical protein
VYVFRSSGRRRRFDDRRRTWKPGWAGTLRLQEGEPLFYSQQPAARIEHEEKGDRAGEYEGEPEKSENDEFQRASAAVRRLGHGNRAAQPCQAKRLSRADNPQGSEAIR